MQKSLHLFAARSGYQLAVERRRRSRGKAAAQNQPRGAVEYAFRAEGTSVEQGRQEGTRLVVYEPGKPPRPVQTPAEDAYEAEVAYFVRCVERDEPVVVATPEDARTALAVALAARESLETGRPVSL
jgi:predicted dehydrogenase